jgi:hypothetical protein
MRKLLKRSDDMDRGRNESGPDRFELPTLWFEATVWIAISLLRLGSAYLLIVAF